MVKKNIVVLGAGFGGLRAAQDIAKGLRHLKLLHTYEIVLIDRSDCHVYIPLLYKVAAGADAAYETKCSYEISALVANLPIRFLNAEMSALDLANGSVHLKTGEELHADYLVIALGSETNYFGIPGLKENALQLKTLESALAIRAAITQAFAKSGDVKIIAGGAGPNGIELAAEIRTWANRAEKTDPNLHVSVSIVEALPNILNGLDTRVAKIAARRLAKLNIPVMLNAKITSVAPHEISIDTGGTTIGKNAVDILPISKIPFDLFIWTGGVKTPEMLAQLPISKDQRGRPLAKGDMALAPMVYGIGDSVCFMNPKTDKPVPAVAHVAILEGRIAARNIIDDIKRTEFSSHNFLGATYHPGEYPYVIPIGERWAVAKFGLFVFSGRVGWMFAELVRLNYLRMILSPVQAWKTWRRG